MDENKYPSGQSLGKVGTLRNDMCEVERAEPLMESIIKEIHQKISHIERELDPVLGQETPRPSQVGTGNSMIHARLNEILDRLQGLHNRISL